MIISVEERLADILSEGNEVNGSKGCMQPAENYQRESNVGDWVFFNSVEGSEIVTAVESPPFESHPKLMDKAVKDDNSDGSDKNGKHLRPNCERIIPNFRVIFTEFSLQNRSTGYAIHCGKCWKRYGIASKLRY